MAGQTHHRSGTLGGMAPPKGTANLALGGAIAVAGAITALAFQHVSIPPVLEWAEAALLAGSLGLSTPIPPAP